MKGKLYLIPNTIDPSGSIGAIPEDVKEIAIGLKHFIVENEKVSRRFLKKLSQDIDISELSFYPMGKHSDPSEYATYINTLKEGNDVGVISDAGCPGVADPGSELVNLAHINNIQVVPLTGPSSILLSIMASGMNGQSFTFHGYLPHENSDRSRAIKGMEQSILSKGQSQIFMDTPYRNNKLIAELISSCKPHIKLCVCSSITSSNESIICKTIADWKRMKYDYHKIPVMLVLGQ